MMKGPKITVRELSGEIWAEVTHERLNMQTGRFNNFDHAAWTAIVDIMTGVIARHIGKTIAVDGDYPAEALPDRIKETFGDE
jgi:hypothetical protein